MFNFEDDHYSSETLINAFHDGYNEFKVNEFNFIPSYEMHLIESGEASKKYFIDEGIDVLEEGNVFDSNS